MGFWSGLSDMVCWVGGKCESASRATLNFISGRRKWGDTLYDDIMQPTIDGHISNLPMEQVSRIANPANASDFGALLTAGGQGSVDTLANVGAKILPDINNNLLGALTPLLIGAGALGGAYLLLEAMTDHSR